MSDQGLDIFKLVSSYHTCTWFYKILIFSHTEPVEVYHCKEEGIVSVVRKNFVSDQGEDMPWIRKSLGFFLNN